MDLFSYKKGRILLILAAICLIAFVVWPFLLGGRSTIETEFSPMNAQMQAMISHAAEEPTPETKPSNTPDFKSTTPTPIPTPIANANKPAKPSATQPKASSPPAPPTSQLDLNTATLEQLIELPGIGESKARAILDYRMQKGRFSRIDELTEVKGIGEKMLVKLKSFLYVTSM
ncbi:competence protein ComEA [Paenibacillus sp. yr247]|uniref:ComEA family DNA-binding protein n=1 Tax=Paenibacillus sp. yr247 TaxID=1761880 RepID=UPI00088033D6|nr:helix-hairpin-helix domain-containing protein [Paenibacillus sp. yr247]SDM87132.1 competence protein ComEA [Paenibacillus sp. yr247]